MSAGDAERKARQIFDAVEYDRKVRKVKSTVEDYLVAEINIANKQYWQKKLFGAFSFTVIFVNNNYTILHLVPYNTA